MTLLKISKKFQGKYHKTSKYLSRLLAASENSQIIFKSFKCFKVPLITLNYWVLLNFVLKLFKKFKNYVEKLTARF